MYEFKPPRTNSKAQSLIMLFFIGAAALLFMTVPLKEMPFLWVIQLIAVLLLVAAVFLVTRYITKAYIYNIGTEDGQTDLTVTELTSGGKRRLIVCRIALSGIRSAEAVREKDEALSKLKKERKKIFDYRPDLSPEKSILVISDEGGEEVILLLAYDEGLLRILKG